MKSMFVIALAGLVGAGCGALVAARPGPPPSALLEDLNTVGKQVKEAEAEVAATGGILAVEARLRLDTLRTTQAMLDRRRLSWMRGISLRYSDAHQGILVSEADASRIQSAITKSEDGAKAAEAEAAQYSGGLIQSLALVRAETERATVAKLRQELAYARAGVPLPDGTASAPPSPGTVVSDKDAL